MSIETIVVTLTGFLVPFIIAFFKKQGWYPTKTEARLVVLGIAIIIAVVAHAITKTWGIDLVASIFGCLTTTELAYQYIVKAIWPE